MIVSDLPPWAIRAFALVFGALWGSFFNVAIYRWPRDMSVVSPPSHCPHCKKPVPAWRNFPIVGYLLLKGRAACCGERLTGRYFLVELSSAALCLALAERYLVGAAEGTELMDASITALLFFAFVGGLLIATFVDLEWLEIPDEVSIGGTALGLATATFHGPTDDVVNLAIGAGGGYLVVQVLLVWSWERLAGRRGMGEGDAKLLMFIGAFLGWEGALFALVGGAFQGIIVTGIVMASGRKMNPSSQEPQGEKAEGKKEAEASEQEAPDGEEEEVEENPSLTMADGTAVRLEANGTVLKIEDEHGRLMWEHVVEPEDEPSLMKRAIPFGPFLALGALEFLFFGDVLIDFYLNLF